MVSVEMAFHCKDGGVSVAMVWLRRPTYERQLVKPAKSRLLFSALPPQGATCDTLQPVCKARSKQILPYGFAAKNTIADKKAHKKFFRNFRPEFVIMEIVSLLLRQA